MSKELTSFINTYIIKNRFNSNASKDSFWSDKNASHLLCELKLRSSGSLQQCVYNYINNIGDDTVRCKVCSNKTKFKSFSVGYLSHCCNSCLQQDPLIKAKKESTSLERYGKKCALSGDKSEMFLKSLGETNPNKLTSVRNKISETNLARYGVINLGQSEEAKTKAKQTCLTKYGTEYAQQSEEIKQKQFSTSLERYGKKCALSGDKSEMFLKSLGVANPSQLPQTQQKIRDNSINKIGVVFQAKHISPLHTSLIDNKEYLLSKSVSEIMKETGYSQSHISKYMFKHGIVDGLKSTLERSVINYIEQIYSGEIIKNTRSVIKPLELDIVIPEFNFAIEVNGDYWHSDEFKKSHYEKFKMCSEKEIYLLQIFEHQIFDARVYDIIKSLISVKLNVIKSKIFARKCALKEVSNKDAVAFLEQNHIDGSCNSKLRYGLYFEDELVSLMTFGKSRFSKDEFELLRFCNKKHTLVVGGASKLFSVVSDKEIISFSDNSYSNGNLYRTLGFEYVHETQGYFYISKSGDKIKRHRVQKHKLKNYEHYNSNLSEKEIMKLNGHLKIYDAKQTKWLYTKKCSKSA